MDPNIVIMGFNANGWVTSYRRGKSILVHDMLGKNRPDAGIIVETDIIN